MKDFLLVATHSGQNSFRPFRKRIVRMDQRASAVVEASVVPRVLAAVSHVAGFSSWVEIKRECRFSSSGVTPSDIYRRLRPIDECCR